MGYREVLSLQAKVLETSNVKRKLVIMNLIHDRISETPGLLAFPEMVEFEDGGIEKLLPPHA